MTMMIQWAQASGGGGGTPGQAVGADISALRQSAPSLVQDAMRQYRAEGNRGVDWAYDRASKEQRDAMDKWLVGEKHPLAYEAGTQNNRLRSIAKQLA